MEITMLFPLLSHSVLTALSPAGSGVYYNRYRHRYHHRFTPALLLSRT